MERGRRPASRTRSLPGVDLVALTGPALRSGWARRAVKRHVPGDERSTRTRLRMFLDGTPG